MNIGLGSCALDRRGGRHAQEILSWRLPLTWPLSPKLCSGRATRTRQRQRNRDRDRNDPASLGGQALQWGGRDANPEAGRSAFKSKQSLRALLFPRAMV